MPLSFRFLFMLLICGLSLNQGAWADQSFKERQLSKQLEESIEDGQAIKLPLDDGEFLALYSEATTPKSRGGVILLHNLGAHPDWPELISPLRTLLPESGWHTLSLQMPLPSDQPTAMEYAELFSEGQKRLASGIEYFNNRGLYNMVVIGHSLGGSIGLNYLASEEGRSSKVIAFVGINAYDHVLINSEMATDKAIADIKVAVLDIVGSLDRQVVLDSAQSRKKQAKKSGKKSYRQINITGADHFFTGLDKQIIKRIKVWLHKQAPSLEIDVDVLSKKTGKK